MSVVMSVVNGVRKTNAVCNPLRRIIMTSCCPIQSQHPRLFLTNVIHDAALTTRISFSRGMLDYSTYVPLYISLVEIQHDAFPIPRPCVPQSFLLICWRCPNLTRTIFCSRWIFSLTFLHCEYGAWLTTSSSFDPKFEDQFWWLWLLTAFVFAERRSITSDA